MAYARFRKLSYTFIVLLFILFALLSVPMNVNAADKDFVIKNGYLSKYQGDGTTVTIPNTVTTIGDNVFYNQEKITSVIIPDSVTSIGSSAFAACHNLKSVTLPSKLKSISSSAFSACWNLQSITLPKSLISINEGAFMSCSSLTSITLPNNLDRIDNSAFSYCSSLKTIKIPDSVSYIGNGAFSECSSLVSINLPDKITSIMGFTFSNCTSLSSIKIPNGVKEIGEATFDNCSSLTTIVIPDSVTTLSNHAFIRCSKLQSVTLPKKLTAVKEYTFYACSSLKTISLPETVTNIGSCAFGECTSLTDINIPVSIQEIATDSFYNTPWYTNTTKDNPLFIVNGILYDATNASGTITVPKEVKEIMPKAFRNSSATEVILLEGVKKIGEFAFASSKLKKITLPEGLLAIGENAFWRSKISNVQLPSTLTSLGAYAFSGCEHLQTVVIPEGITTLEEETFSYCTNLNKITLPKSLSSLEKQIFLHDDKLRSIQVNSDNPNFTGDGSFLFNKDKTELLICSIDSGEVIIPEGTKSVAEGVFEEAKVSKVTFPSTLQTLKDNIFYMCAELTQISLPSSFISFGVQKFQHCKKFETITIYETKDTKNYSSEAGVLYNADQTILVCDPHCGDLEVADSVIQIENNAFPNADMSITIPKTVTDFADNILTYDYLWKPADEEPFTIYGYKGSAAEAYSNKHEIYFLAFDGTYSITYKLDGGTNNSENPSTYTIKSGEIIFKQPVKTGYNFLYWYEDISICEDGDCRGERIVSSILPESLGDLELIAKWEKVTVGKAVINSLKKSAATKISLSLKSVEGAAGYEIAYAKDSKFTSSIKTVTSTSTSAFLSNLNKGSTYYIKARAYKLDSMGNKVYGAYSVIKKYKLS